MRSKKTQQRRPRWLRTCLFCGASGKLTEEHIFGDWLRKIGYDGSGIREIGDPPITQLGGPFSKTLKVVCGSCNNGWMSQLEQAAKPLLMAMFNANGGKVQLDDAAQLVLARWAFKTAVVAVYADNTQVKDPFPEAHRSSFYQEDQPPEQAHIWIGTAKIPPIGPKGEHLVDYSFEPGRLTWTTAETTTGFRSYRVTFRLLNVVFDIFGYVTTDITLNGDPDEKLRFAVLPLWPRRHPTIWWPPVISLDNFGGVPGLTAAKLVGIPTILLNKQC